MSERTTRPPVFPELDGTQACRDEDPELFFASDEPHIAVAKSICASCPLLRPCLAYALTHAVAGVWGGTTEDERRNLRRRHDIPLAREPRMRRPPEPVPTTPLTDWS